MPTASSTWGRGKGGGRGEQNRNSEAASVEPHTCQLGVRDGTAWPERHRWTERGGVCIHSARPHSDLAPDHSSYRCTQPVRWTFLTLSTPSVAVKHLISRSDRINNVPNTVRRYVFAATYTESARGEAQHVYTRRSWPRNGVALAQRFRL